MKLQKACISILAEQSCRFFMTRNQTSTNCEPKPRFPNTIGCGEFPETDTPVAVKLLLYTHDSFILKTPTLSSVIGACHDAGWRKSLREAPWSEWTSSTSTGIEGWEAARYMALDDIASKKWRGPKIHSVRERELPLFLVITEHYSFLFEPNVIRFLHFIPKTIIPHISFLQAVGFFFI